MYVHNRVQRIRQTTKPEQWHYVHTEDNPADLASRSVPASLLAKTTWFTGPHFLMNTPNESEQAQPFSKAECFQRFSSLSSLIQGIAFLIHNAKSHIHFKRTDKCKGWHKCDLPRTPEELSQAKEIIIGTVQKRAFPKEFKALMMNEPVHPSSNLLHLSPILQNNLICLGDRLKNANLDIGETNPIILPKDNHVSLLFVRHYHSQVQHQGRHLKEGALRAAGF